MAKTRSDKFDGRKGRGLARASGSKGVKKLVARRRDRKVWRKSLDRSSDS